MPKFFDTTADRRQTPRTKLAEIAYIGMGPENGGLVLDVSDGGLSFHAVAPVQPAQTIHFLLSLRDQSRIEGAGEVVWTNEMRTVCGLRFISLSSGAREHLSAWTSPSRTVEGALEEASSPASPMTLPTETVPHYLASESDANAEPLFAIPPADEDVGSEGQARLPWQKPLIFWIAFGFLGAALMVAAFIYGVDVGKSEIGSTAQSPAIPGPQTQPPSLAPGLATPSPVGGGANSVPNAARANPPRPKDATATPLHRLGAEAHGSVTPGQNTPLLLETGKSELAAALAYLNGKNRQRDGSIAVQLLWEAVGKGNAAAEVVLADLYLNGDIVAKNCEQGRVLLLAATRSGSAQAKIRLNDLNTKGCP